jgi:hypothetical protein
MTEGWSLPGAAAKMRKAKNLGLGPEGDTYTLPPEVADIFVKYTSKHNLSVIEMFRKCDADMDGIINGKEFMGGLSSLQLGLTVPQMENVVQFVDGDGDGKIEYHEFVKVFHRLVPMTRHADAAIPEFDAKAKTDMLHYLERIQQASKDHREQRMKEDMRKVTEQDADKLYSHIDGFLDTNAKFWSRAEQTEQGWLSKDFANSGIPCKFKPSKKKALPSIGMEGKVNMSVSTIGLGGFAKLFG